MLATCSCDPAVGTCGIAAQYRWLHKGETETLVDGGFTSLDFQVIKRPLDLAGGALGIVVLQFSVTLAWDPTRNGPFDPSILYLYPLILLD